MSKLATRTLVGGCWSLCFVAGVTLAGTGDAVTVVQKDRKFQTNEIEIQVGDIVHFTNEDEFLHQLYTETPQFSFDSDPQSPGDTLDVTFSTAGNYEVHCGIHPKMLLKVEVD